MGLLILDHCACLLLRNQFDFEFELSRPQGQVKWQKVICASWFLVLFCLFLTIMFLLCFSWSLLSFFKSFLLQNGWQTVAVAFGLLGHLILVRVDTLLDSSNTSRTGLLLETAKNSSWPVTGLKNRGPLKDLKDSKLILNESKLFPWSSRINLMPFRIFWGPLFYKPVTGQELFYAVCYSKPALVVF